MALVCISLYETNHQSRFIPIYFEFPVFDIGKGNGFPGIKWTLMKLVDLEPYIVQRAVHQVDHRTTAAKSMKYNVRG